MLLLKLLLSHTTMILRRLHIHRPIRHSNHRHRHRQDMFQGYHYNHLNQWNLLQEFLPEPM
jgi:hypothetical protein